MELKEQPNDQNYTGITSYQPLFFHRQNVLYNNILQSPLHLPNTEQWCSVIIRIIWWLTEYSLMCSSLFLSSTSEQKGLQHLGLYFRMIFSFHPVLHEMIFCLSHAARLVTGKTEVVSLSLHILYYKNIWAMKAILKTRYARATLPTIPRSKGFEFLHLL